MIISRKQFLQLFARKSERRQRFSKEQAANPWSFGRLEERVLLAADSAVACEVSAVIADQTSTVGIANEAAVDTSEIADDGVAEHDVAAASNVLPLTPSPRPVVFLDGRIDAIDALQADLRDRADVVVVSPEQSGIDVITQTLRQTTLASSIHIIGHGESGFAQLGREGLRGETLAGREAELARWRDSVVDGGDLMLYGCYTGAGPEGQELVEALSAWTGLDVAASDNATGNRDAGGDWVFEVATGSIESSVIFSNTFQERYDSVMQIVVRAAGQTGDETMELQIDGQTVETWNNVGGDLQAGVFQTFTHQASGVSADRIRVAFTNDLFLGSEYDRNLRVESITTDGLTIRSDDPSVFVSGTWDSVSNQPAEGFLQVDTLHLNGFFQYAQPDSGDTTEIVIQAAGETGQEQMQLLIDTQVVAIWDDIGGNPDEQVFESFRFTSDGTVTADQIRVAFTNDFFDPENNIDRNLYVQGITVGGVEYRTDAPTVFSTGTWDSQANAVVPGFLETQVLHVNGYFAYSSGSVNEGSEIVIVASGSEGGEQMNLRIDGLVARTWIVGTGADQGQFQTYVYRADGLITADSVQIEFVGDEFIPGVLDKNLRVREVSIDGETFATVAPDVLSTGTWAEGGIAPGFWQNEYLHVDGYFQFTTGGPNPGALALAQNRYDVDEDAGSLSIEVVREGGADGSLVVDFATVAGTALPGLDYVESSGSLIFLPGQTSAAVEMVILDDDLYEGNETFNFTIDNLRGNGTLGAPRTATILINDTDAVLPDFPIFTSTDALFLNSDAVIDDQSLRLTRDLNSLKGSAYFATPMPISASTSFQTSFGFRIDGGQGTGGADGFSFIVQNSDAGPAAISEETGGSIGYQGIDRSLVVEFDTFQNPTDPSNNHVGVVLNGSAMELVTRNPPFVLNSGADLRAWVDYNGDSQQLAVYLGDGPQKPNNPLIVTNIDLETIVGPQGYLGFTAATGGLANNHRILDWTFSLTPPTIAPPVPGTELVDQVVSAGYVRPTAIDFSPDGRNIYVAQQDGVVYVVRDGQRLETPFVDISAQVNGVRDRGLLDIAVHPDFENNPYFYLLFTYDPPEVFENIGNPLAGPNGVGNRAGRLIRVTADAATNYTTAVTGSDVLLLGSNSTWDNFNAFVNSTNDFNEPPAGILPDGTNLVDFIATDSESHTVGAMEFGPDGALYVSIGDGTSYNRVDPRTVRVQDIDNLSGKILRIDPLTGAGLSDNPFFDGDPGSNRSKVYQLGLRNPFRIAFDSETGRLFNGDVGWNRWEEVNAGGPGANFGWPYFEGGNEVSIRTQGYQNLPEAQAFYASGQAVDAPVLGLSHAATGINAIVLGAVYRGDVYPEQYDGNLFFNDLGQGFVSSVSFNSDGTVDTVSTFATGARFVVHISQGIDGNLYYVNLVNGTVGRWLFV